MSLNFFACGDVVNIRGKKNFIDDKLIQIVQSSDIAICNFEAPIKIENMKPINKVGPYVYQSKESVKYLKKIGFDVLSLANNHIYDYGDEALKKTIDEIKNYDLIYIGAGNSFDEAYRTKIIEKGIRIGLFSACENEFGCLYERQKRGGYAWINHYLIEDKIRELKTKVDFVVFIAHAGIENIDFPIKDWRDRYQRLCDVGVDVVIGHHPHVPQGYEKYDNSLIFYSLGNFYFDIASFVDKSDDSYSVLLNFKENKKIDFEIIYHKKIDGQTTMVNKEDVTFSIKQLNGLLQKDYEKNNDEISVKLFYKYYYGYYESAIGKLPKNTTILQYIKFMIKKLLFKNRGVDGRNLLLLHNIRIDSHRFIVQKALSLISERGNK